MPEGHPKLESLPKCTLCCCCLTVDCAFEAVVTYVCAYWKHLYYVHVASVAVERSNNNSFSWTATSGPAKVDWQPTSDVYLLFSDTLTQSGRGSAAIRRGNSKYETWFIQAAKTLQKITCAVINQTWNHTYCRVSHKVGLAWAAQEGHSVRTPLAALLLLLLSGPRLINDN